jgi:hypothetical protein
VLHATAEAVTRAMPSDLSDSSAINSPFVLDDS